MSWLLVLYNVAFVVALAWGNRHRLRAKKWHRRYQTALSVMSHDQILSVGRLNRKE